MSLKGRQAGLAVIDAGHASSLVDASGNASCGADDDIVEKVIEGSVCVKVSDEPELGARVDRGAVRSDVAQDVFVA